MGVPDYAKLELIPIAKSLVKLGLTYVLKEADIDHGSIAGLADDDHTGYILVTGARAFTGDQAMGNHKITGLATPTAAADAVNKTYADGIGGFPATTKMLFKQAAAPTGWTIDDTIQDNSMVVYRRGAGYGVDGGSGDPTSYSSPAMNLKRVKYGGSDYNAVEPIGSESASSGGMIYTLTGGTDPWYGLHDEILAGAITITPLYTHVIVATKD